MPVLRIATRKSPLALWQAAFVRDALCAEHVDLQVELIGFTTRGDKILDTPLAKIGGKGLFVKELEQALLDGRADIAVHSMKDVPMVLPEGLALPVICEREDPRDALVASGIASLKELPPGARVGTSSLRRQSQLRARYPQLEFVDLRGNVNTRLARLAEGRYQAIVLASAGLHRLRLEAHIAGYFSTSELLPAGGQGAIGIECRENDAATRALLEPLHHTATAACVSAERALNRRLNGGCQVPIAAFAEVDGNGNLDLRALVASLDGATTLRDRRGGELAEAEALGIAAAQQLLDQGADRILAGIGI